MVVSNWSLVNLEVHFHILNVVPCSTNNLITQLLLVKKWQKCWDCEPRRLFHETVDPETVFIKAILHPPPPTHPPFPPSAFKGKVLLDVSEEMQKPTNVYYMYISTLLLQSFTKPSHDRHPPSPSWAKWGLPLETLPSNCEPNELCL